MGVAKVWANPSSSSADKPNPTRVDLARFKQRPEKSEKISNMVERVCDAVVDPWMKKVVSSACCSRGLPLGTLPDWNPVRAPCEHTCAVQTAKASTAKMNSKGANGHPCRIPRCGVDPAPLRSTVNQDGEGGSRHTLLHPPHPCLRKSPMSKDVLEKTPINIVIGLGKIHLPHESGGAIPTPCSYYLFCQHNTVCHLPA